MTTLTIRPPAAGFTAAQTATLASLPETFRAAADGSVRLVDGKAGWAQRAGAEITSGARAVIVERPAPDSSEAVRQLRDLARAEGVTVVVNSPYVGSPTWMACRDRLIADAATAAVVDGVVVARQASELERGLLALIAVVRPLSTGVRLRRLHPGSTTLVTDGAGIAASLSSTASQNPCLTLDLVGPGVRWRIELPDDDTARPGRATRYDGTGEASPRPIHAAASRTTWKALAAALSGNPGSHYDLDQLLLDLAVLEQA